MKSSIYISNISCVDHAWCAPESNYTIQGGSYLASFIITGDIEQHEQVVVDFSTLKKSIKEVLDNRGAGPDHKLWVYEKSWTINRLEDDDQRVLENDSVILSIPKDACFFVGKEFENYNLETSTKIIEKYVQEYLNILYKGLTVQCFLSEKPEYVEISKFMYHEDRMFRYFHGLKNSTSWACQNIAHGHLSYVSFYYDYKYDTNIELDIYNEINKFYNEINGCGFVMKENVVEENDHYITVEYTTEERGRFKAIYNKHLNKIIILDDETTIENLIRNLVRKYLDTHVLKSLGVKHIAISEGLQKGSIITL